MPQEEEGVRKVSGEPRGCAGEPEQNPHRGTESPQRLVLPQIRVGDTCQWLDRCPSVPVYRDSAQSHASGCHFSPPPPFLLFCFLFKNCLKRICESNSPGIKKKPTPNNFQNPTVVNWNPVPFGQFEIKLHHGFPI